MMQCVVTNNKRGTNEEEKLQLSAAFQDAI